MGTGDGLTPPPPTTMSPACFVSAQSTSLPTRQGIMRILLLAALQARLCVAQFGNSLSIRTPVITDVSAMCTEGGITAQVMFDGEFGGKIYSHRYGTTHDCVYYNVVGMNMILFDIPNYQCGTRLNRTPDNRVSHIENEVYVQFDKDTQGVTDRRYLFVCDIAPNSNSIDGFVGGTLNPSKTVIVQTIEPTRIVITQEGGGFGTGTVNPGVTMSIRDGESAFGAPVSRPLKLGDPITLVVSSRHSTAGSAFNNTYCREIFVGRDYEMFVHSCFASDGGGGARVELIDRAGCSLRGRIVREMQRERTGTETLYYFTMSAFKFPSSDDVYFSCSVDLCRLPRASQPGPMARAAGLEEICPGGRGKRSADGSPEAPLVSPTSAPMEELLLHDFVQFEQEIDDYSRISSSEQHATHAYCFTTTALMALVSTFALTLFAFLIMSVFVFTSMRQRRRLKSVNGSGAGSSTATVVGEYAENWKRYRPWSSYSVSRESDSVGRGSLPSVT